MSISPLQIQPRLHHATLVGWGLVRKEVVNIETSDSVIQRRSFQKDVYVFQKAQSFFSDSEIAVSCSEESANQFP